jgi:putative drug exporter of the RND superfamily
MRLSSAALARRAARHPWRTIGVWALSLLIAAAVIVLVLPGTLTSQYKFLGRPGSQVGQDLLAQKLNMPQKANEAVVVRSPSLTAADPAFRAFTLGVQRRIAALGPKVVDGVASYALGGNAATMVSKDGHTAIIPLTMAGDLTQAEHNIDKVHAVVHRADGRQGFSTLITGTASINSDFSHTANSDLQKGEGIGVPIALVILLLVFGALVAALLPIFLALVAITFAVALTALVGQTFSVSVFAINMISMMGLATGIDYSLFIVSRFREERAKGRDKIDAIGVAGGTATRAVVFSGITVVLALCGLLIVPTNIFVSLAIGAILVVSMSVLAALTLLPAVLGLLGDGVNRLRVPYLGKRLLRGRAEGRVSWLARLAQRAMRHPVLVLVVGVAVLLACAAPALTMKTGVSGVNTFPNSFQSKAAFGILERQFNTGTVSPVQIVIDRPAASPAVKAGIGRLTAALARDKAYGPPQTQTSATGDLTLISVPLNGESTGAFALGKIRDLRASIVPQAFGGLAGSVYVTGQTAGNLDYINIVNSHFAWVVGLVLALSFVLLLVAFRSVVIPAKAIVMNLLSVGAAYGLITLVSLHGVGAGVLGFEHVPVIEQWVPLFLFSILFGLSMDYQVFLLSRIKEEWDRTGDNTFAVTQGVGSTAGIITGAALIMVAVFAGFASGNLVMFQQMGFGLAVAVLLDATLIRTLLVPAAMKLLGHWNWYLPAWLDWLPHVGIEGAPAPVSRPEAGRQPAPGGDGHAAAPEEQAA